MADAAQRAAARRATWTGGVAKSFGEMEDADLDFWLAASLRTRLMAVFELNETLNAIAGEHEPTLRLDRSVGGVRPRKG